MRHPHLGLVIHAIHADTRRTITSCNLITDFGHSAINARTLMQAMADALAAELSVPGSSKIKMLFEEWRTLYGQVADMSILQADAINQEIGFLWNGFEEQSMAGRLFVIHTYNSLLIKLLAAEIVSAHGLTTTQQPAQAMAALLDDAALLNTLSQDIERAGIFTQAGVNGFVEEAVFSWYLDVARKPPHSISLMPALRSLLASLSLYRTDHLTHTRDVLRDLYQALVPGKLRQSLGEFYTPDWLVDFTIEQAKNGAWLNKRVLDPTCGSGAFMIAVLRLMREEAVQDGWDSAHILEHLCASVWGFDLNPLAVQTARVNFLMEIVDLLKASPGHTLEIPVLLADAIYSPASDPAKGYFDCIVGNPPWVRWSKLPEAYRERVKPTCERYGIFSKNKRHGGNELDISAMITYATADKWLKTDGRLAFVITGTIFKNPSSAGFRKLRLEPSNPKTLHLTPVCVDDMKALKPFDDASNHTSVVVFNKTVKPGSYPVPYRLWDSAPGNTKAIPVAMNLSDVMLRVKITTKEAAPVDEEGSPWAVLTKGRYKILQTLSGKCGWVAGRKGITADLNGVFFVPIIKKNDTLVQVRSRPEAGKKDIGTIKTDWV